jgi:hypothetical protein
MIKKTFKVSVVTCTSCAMEFESLEDVLEGEGDQCQLSLP